jgi:hypothetical protein
MARSDRSMIQGCMQVVFTYSKQYQVSAAFRTKLIDCLDSCVVRLPEPNLLSDRRRAICTYFAMLFTKEQPETCSSQRASDC